jgi:photosystem II stability/assembly factor-like uncharacterized protein
MHVEPAPDFGKSQTLWVATWGAGVLRSDDGGKTFGATGPGLADLEVNEVRAAPGTTSMELYACTRNAGVFYSMDGGKAWTHTALRVEISGQTKNHYTSLALSPAWPRDKTVLCASFEGLNISRDGGTTWRESNVNPPRIGRILAVSPTYDQDGHVFGCGYGMHLLVSPDRTKTWDVRFTGLSATSVYSIGVSPKFADDQLVILGVHKGVRRSEDGGRKWKAIRFDEIPGETKLGYTMRALTFAPGYPADKRVFSTGSAGMFFRSEDLGKTWRHTVQVSNWTTGIALSTEFEKDNTLYVAGRHIFVSEDAGDTFSGPHFKGHVYGNSLVCAPDFAETGEMFAIARYKGFILGTKRGYVWKESNEGLEGYAPSAMKMSPNFANDNTIYVLTSGGGLFRSVDRGRSWGRVSEFGGPIDQGFSMAISPDFAKDQTIFVGTFAGFWTSSDAGVNWVQTTSREVYDERRDPWKWHGDWKRDFGNSSVNNSVTWSQKADEVASISFEGIGCKLYGPKGPNYGIAEVQLDNGDKLLVDQYAEKPVHQAVLFEAGSLTSGNHRIAVRVTGKKSAGAKGVRVAVDALEVVFR